MTRLVTTKEAADYLRVSTATVLRWCREGRLPACQIGRQWRINMTELEKVISSDNAGPKSGASQLQASA